MLIPAESKTFWQIRGEDKLQTSFLVERGFSMLEKPLNLKREKTMGYYSLTEITAVQYAKDHGYFEAKANVVCHEMETET